MKFRSINHANRLGFTLVELLVVIVISSIIVTGLYTFLGKQRKQTKTLRLQADVESLAQISFFIMGRDIRRAGSNPMGWGAFNAGEPIAFDEARSDRLVIRADLDGDGTVEFDTDERIIYEFIDDPLNPDGIPDQIRRQAGDQLLIENVKLFEFCYWLGGSIDWECRTLTSGEESLVKRIRMHLVAGTGRLNPQTGVEDTKEIQMVIRPRNFDL